MQNGLINNNMIFTKRNLLRVIAIAIPIFVIKFFGMPFLFLLRDITPTSELGIFIIVSNTILTISVNVIAVLICIKIWNRTQIDSTSHM